MRKIFLIYLLLPFLKNIFFYKLKLKLILWKCHQNVICVNIYHHKFQCFAKSVLLYIHASIDHRSIYFMYDIRHIVLFIFFINIIYLRNILYIYMWYNTYIYIYILQFTYHSLCLWVMSCVYESVATTTTIIKRTYYNILGL